MFIRINRVYVKNPQNRGSAKKNEERGGTEWTTTFKFDHHFQGQGAERPAYDVTSKSPCAILGQIGVGELERKMGIPILSTNREPAVRRRNSHGRYCPETLSSNQAQIGETLSQVPNRLRRRLPRKPNNASNSTSYLPIAPITTRSKGRGRIFTQMSHATIDVPKCLT